MRDEGGGFDGDERRSENGGRDHAEAGRHDGDFDRGGRGKGFPVRVDEAGRGAPDRKAGAPPAAHPRTAVDIPEEEPGGEHGGPGQAHRADDDQIEKAVIHAGAGSDVGAAAVLVGVGDGDEKDFKGFPSNPVGDFTGFGPPFPEGRQRGRA